MTLLGSSGVLMSCWMCLPLHDSPESGFTASAVWRLALPGSEDLRQFSGTECQYWHFR